MRYCRFLHQDSWRYGRIEGEVIALLHAAPWVSDEAEGTRVALADATLGVPTAAGKILCIGQNYRKHAEEMGKPVPTEPLLFLKPSTALNPHLAPIRIPAASHEVHHESELGLVIGKRLTCASEAEAEAAIFALTCFNDVTARDIQRKETQHTRAKGYDTFACAGPWMVTGLSSDDLRVQCRVNGQVRQDGRTSDMVFPPARLVSFMSHVMTLEPGDLIATGTPSGVGQLLAGDQVEVEIEGIGTLRNPVLEGR